MSHSVKEARRPPTRLKPPSAKHSDHRNVRSRRRCVPDGLARAAHPIGQLDEERADDGHHALLLRWAFAPGPSASRLWKKRARQLCRPFQPKSSIPRPGSTTSVGSSLSATRRMSAALCRADKEGIATKARCGVISTCCMPHSRSSAGSGSRPNTSSVALPMRPPWRSAVSAACRRPTPRGPRSPRRFWSAIRCARKHPRNHRSQGFQSRKLQTVLVPGPMSLTSPAPAAGWHGRVDCSLSMAEERAHTETRPEFSMVWLQPSRA